MLVMCAHTWNPKAPGMTEKEFLAMREKFMKGLMGKKLPVKSVQAALNFEQGKGWCLWETDTVARLEGIMADHLNVQHGYHPRETCTPNHVKNITPTLPSPLRGGGLRREFSPTVRGGKGGDCV